MACRVVLTAAGVMWLLATQANGQVREPVSQQERMIDAIIENNPGHLLTVLRETLCLDIREARFDASSELLVATIRDKQRVLLSATQHQ